MTDPDPRTASDDVETPTTNEGVTNEGVSAPEPAEGADDAPGGDEGSPNG